MVFVHIRLHVVLVMYFVWWIYFLYTFCILICYTFNNSYDTYLLPLWFVYVGVNISPPDSPRTLVPWILGFSRIFLDDLNHAPWVRSFQANPRFSLEVSSNQTDPGSVSADTWLVVNKGRANLLAVPRECRTAPAAALQLAFSRVNHA